MDDFIKMAFKRYKLDSILNADGLGDMVLYINYAYNSVYHRYAEPREAKAVIQELISAWPNVMAFSLEADVKVETRDKVLRALAEEVFEAGMKDARSRGLIK